LEKTKGVPLFQEQAMQIAIVAAGFTPSEADGLRRAMATFRHTGNIQFYRGRMIKGMVERGYEVDFAERCFKQIEGFGKYGFPESHAASFALLFPPGSNATTPPPSLLPSSTANLWDSINPPKSFAMPKTTAWKCVMSM
jgi:hypothetical protein